MTLSNAAVLALLLAGSSLFREWRQPPPESYPPLQVAGAAESRTQSDWQRHRSALLGKVRGALGPFPAPLPVQAEEQLREEQPDHTRILLRYRVEPELWTEAYLLLPKGFSGKRPGAVVLHATSATHMRDPVGLSGREAMHIALHLVRKGYVCIAPRNYLWSEPGKSYQQAAAEVLRRWKTGMARMTWDAIRATDILAARPEVDPKRLGSIGHSLGGKEVLYHAALDPRIRAAVSCEGGVGLSFSNWDAPWYLGAQIKEPDFPLGHHEVLALVAPRAFLLIGGESADGAKSWPYIEANLPVWRLFGKEERLGLFRHTYGHDMPPPGPDRERVYAWLEHWLRR